MATEKITLPFPPSANRYWRSCRGRVFVSAEAKAYKKEAAALAFAAGLRPVSGAVILCVDVFRPQKSGDLGNRIKVLEDALQGVAFFDDKQVVEIHARRFDDKTNPRVEVKIVEAAP